VWRVFPEVNVERRPGLRPYLRRPDSLGGDAGPPPPVIGADGGQEHGWGCATAGPTCLCAGRAGDTWEPLDTLTNHPRLRAGHWSLPSPAAAAAAPPPPILLAGFNVDAAPPGDLGASLVGRALLYWWPDERWQCGTVARPCSRGAFSHVVAYTRQTSPSRPRALRGTADTLLDAASCGARWVLFSTAPAAGVVRALRARAPRP
jgi:hypothetical protein